MTTYLLNEPVASDDLSISQPKLAANCNALDTVYGLDHFAFSNASLEQGLHNKVTTPAYQNPIGTASAATPTTTTYPIAYCFQPLTGAGGTPTTNLGLLQYSKPTPNNATTNPEGSDVPTPITSIQSSATGVSIGIGATINVFDFAGMAGAMANLYAANYDAATFNFLSVFVFWTGTVLRVQVPVVGAGLAPVVNGSILQIQNNSGVAITQLRWTLEFERTE